MKKEILQVYKCHCCNFTLEVLTSEMKEGCCDDLSCCGEAMQLLETKTQDAGKEKHVPVLKEGQAGVKICVGDVPHPMEEDHYIQWIEVVNGPYQNRKFLKPTDKPEAEFYVPKQEGLKVRIYCNKHGLWKGE
jgi:superoxide reductase